ncbi:hypothetical protein BJ508DRAFT_367821 [Ascobolus immersus RN42]|uniref:Uncharacterized protein n=1 Tax=Ascobolus immersus RN42 TaxID=1160509 RepID=A0A3N4H9F5_ASCIM|nr:hypothetical protein BJ508DRAFT_367821 [Ascobolus immersus RN42]
MVFLFDLYDGQAAVCDEENGGYRKGPSKSEMDEIREMMKLVMKQNEESKERISALERKDTEKTKVIESLQTTIADMSLELRTLTNESNTLAIRALLDDTRDNLASQRGFESFRHLLRVSNGNWDTASELLLEELTSLEKENPEVFGGLSAREVNKIINNRSQNRRAGNSMAHNVDFERIDSAISAKPSGSDQRDMLGVIKNIDMML